MKKIWKINYGSREISFYGLSDLILLKGTMNDFTHPKATKFFKKKYDLFKEKNENLYFY